MQQDNVISLADYRRPVRFLHSTPNPYAKPFGPREMWRAIELHQPVILYEARMALTRDYAESRLHGIEASPCLIGPDNSVLSPSQLVRQVELFHLLVPFGRMLLERCCADLAQLRGQGVAVDYVCLDLPIQLLNEDAGLYQHVAHCLDRYGLRAADLMLGINENEPSPVEDTAWRTLNKLTATGTRIMLHTSGLDLTSQHLLGRLPIHALLLDRRLVARLPGDESMRWLAQALLTMAGNLNIEVIADGVSNSAQQTYLSASRCPFAQGQAIASPMRLNELITHLAAHTA